MARKVLAARTFFNIAERLRIKEALDAFKGSYGRRGMPWLATQIATELPKGTISNAESFRKAVDRFMADPIGVRDSTVAKVQPFAVSLKDGALPAAAMVRGAAIRIELAINDRFEPIIFHNHPFPHDLSWLDFDPDTNQLTFVMGGGAIRDFAIAVRQELEHYMLKAAQVLVVLTDAETNEPVEGGYIHLSLNGAPPAARAGMSASFDPLDQPATFSRSRAILHEASWRSFTGAKVDTLIREVLKCAPGYTFATGKTRILWRELPFYDNTLLLRVRDSSWREKALSIYFLAHEDTLYRLLGHSPPVHEMNLISPIRLTADNVLDYLRFFCFFIRAENGPFLILESADDPDMPKEVTYQARKTLDGTLRPAVCRGFTGAGVFLCDAFVFHADVLFLANFQVKPNGLVDMLGETVVQEHLLSRVNFPLG